ncbi:hypothetical protein SELMODRAFT_427592 [Selaginella moellendorffii]|uniref:Uncharacterized protein n=1 Tax=Selaginella moellendorffii TaxID=88036 RepID=D8T037_SELML|nr:hypothetical protein SELMODRAFT_427592 [Selaginella moellendorffii]
MPPGCIKIIENYNSRSSLQMSNVTDEAKPRLKFLISTLKMCMSSSSASKAIIILYDNLQHKIKVNIASYLHEKLIKEIHSATKLIHGGQKCETLTLPYVAALVPAFNLTFPLSVKRSKKKKRTRRSLRNHSQDDDGSRIKKCEGPCQDLCHTHFKGAMSPMTTPPAKRTKITTVSPPKNRTKSTTSQIKSIISKEKPEEKSQEQSQEINLDSISTPTNGVAVHAKQEGPASPPTEVPVDDNTMPQHHKHHSRECPDQERCRELEQDRQHELELPHRLLSSSKLLQECKNS